MVYHFLVGFGLPEVSKSMLTFGYTSGPGSPIAVNLKKNAGQESLCGIPSLLILMIKKPNIYFFK